jgi:hypothetical protein
VRVIVAFSLLDQALSHTVIAVGCNGVGVKTCCGQDFFFAPAQAGSASEAAHVHMSLLGCGSPGGEAGWLHHLGVAPDGAAGAVPLCTAVYRWVPLGTAVLPRWLLVRL